jgi:hypothetical protein
LPALGLRLVPFLVDSTVTPTNLLQELEGNIQRTRGAIKRSDAFLLREMSLRVLVPVVAPLPYLFGWFLDVKILLMFLTVTIFLFMSALMILHSPIHL